MKKQIRQNVFETNSSSTHSISIAEKNNSELMDNSLIPDSNGYINLGGGEFGWEFKKYNDALTKSNYVSVLLMHLKHAVIRHKEKPEHNEYYDLPKWADENYGQCYRNFNEVITEQTGCKYVSINASSHYKSNNWSYIDHQSCEDVKDNEWLLNKEKIRQFIFNKNSWLCTGNDNSNHYWEFKDGEEPVLAGSDDEDHEE